MFEAFFTGAADAVNQDLDKRRDHAFTLKLLSKKIEMEEQSQKNMLDYGGFDADESKQLGALAGMNIDRPTSVPRAGLLGSMARTNANASARMFSGRDSMTVKEFNESRGVKLPLPENTTLNPMQVRVWMRRLDTEEPTSEAKAGHFEIKDGMNLIAEIRKARAEAAAEMGQGPLAGRAATALSEAEQGAIGPKTKKYLSLVKGSGTKIARLQGEKGVVTDRDVEKALNIVPGLKVSPQASDEIFNTVESLAKGRISEYEEAYPALRRKRENEEAGKGISSVGKKASAMNKDEARKLFLEAIKEAAKGAKK